MWGVLTNGQIFPSSVTILGMKWHCCLHTGNLKAHKLFNYFVISTTIRSHQISKPSGAVRNLNLASQCFGSVSSDNIGEQPASWRPRNSGDRSMRRFWFSSKSGLGSEHPSELCTIQCIYIATIHSTYRHYRHSRHYRDTPFQQGNTVVVAPYFYKGSKLLTLDAQPEL